MTTTTSAQGAHRAIAITLLIGTGIISLPVSAAFLDGDSTEDLIVPVQLVVMALVGALVGYALPGLGGPRSSRSRSAGIGVVGGLVTALLAVAVFYLLLG